MPLSRSTSIAIAFLTCAGCTTTSRLDQKRPVLDRPASSEPTREDQDPVAKASKLWASGKVDEAAVELKAAIEQDPGNARARYLYATLLVDRGELRAAVSELELVVAKTEGDPLAWDRLGEVRERLGEHRAALEAYTRVA